MGELMLSLLGIIVSVLLFLIGYRRTIGAKKQRIRNANSEIEKILIRRISLEGYQPSLNDISKLISGKSAEHKVRKSDLQSEEQILNNLFTKIIETDFITADKRNEIINRLTSISEEEKDESYLEIGNLGEEELNELKASRKNRYYKIALVSIYAILVSVIGASITIFPALSDFQSLESLPQEILLPLLITGGFSLAIIVLFLAYYRYKNEQIKELSKIEQINEYVDFENDILNILANANTLIKTSGSEEGFDFIAQKGKQKLLIELKSWDKAMPLSLIKRISDKLENAVMKENADKAILVTPSKLKIPKQLQTNNSISLMSKKEFKKYFKHNS